MKKSLELRVLYVKGIILKKLNISFIVLFGKYIFRLDSFWTNLYI